MSPAVFDVGDGCHQYCHQRFNDYIFLTYPWSELESAWRVSMCAVFLVCPSIALFASFAHFNATSYSPSFKAKNSYKILWKFRISIDTFMSSLNLFWNRFWCRWPEHCPFSLSRNRIILYDLKWPKPNKKHLPRIHWFLLSPKICSCIQIFDTSCNKF